MADTNVKAKGKWSKRRLTIEKIADQRATDEDTYLKKGYTTKVAKNYDYELVYALKINNQIN